MRKSWSPGLLAVLLTATASQATAAVPLSGQAFPVPSSLVPLVVGAVFVLPAALAGLLSLVRRSRAGLGVIVAATTVAAVLYARPDVLHVIR
jgi:hypothetical protein